MLKKLKRIFFPRASASTPAASLFQHPLPLYSPEQKLALFWSAKAGCTFAVKWFFFQTGELEKALAYHPWVHNFRENIFCSRQGYDKILNNILNTDTRVVKVVRNPYARAVSSYLMAVRAGYENDKLSEVLGRIIDNEHGFSFDEFLDYLSTIDLRCCNIHHRLQIHPAEEKGYVKPDFLIKLENSFNEISACERALELKKAPLESFRKSGHNTFRREWLEYWGDVKFYRNLGSKMLPNPENFYSAGTLKKIESLYEADLIKYSYSKDRVDTASASLLSESPETLLTQVVEQFPVSGPVELLSKVEGFWPDSWCGSTVTINFRALAKITQLEMYARLPGSLLLDNDIQLRCGSYSKVYALTNAAADSTLSFLLDCEKDQDYTLKITSQKAISPKARELSEDSRLLSFYLIQILFNRSFGDNRRGGPPTRQR